MCDTLKITLTELEQQPADWVETMLDYLSHKQKIQEAKIKEDQARAKASRGKRI